MSNLSRADYAALAEVQADFEEFFCARLRRRMGCKVGSAMLLASYQAWARLHHRGSITHRELRRMMESRGCRLIKSNRMAYNDCEFVAVMGGQATPVSQAVLNRIDALQDQLIELRTALCHA